ncbi:MAG: hypothetical protein IRF16MM_00435 [Candidatus Midichloria mitochondrii]
MIYQKVGYIDIPTITRELFIMCVNDLNGES